MIDVVEQKYLRLRSIIAGSQNDTAEASCMAVDIGRRYSRRNRIVDYSTFMDL